MTPSGASTPHQACARQQHVAKAGGYLFDGQFRRRIFVITNHGIQVLREIALEERCEKCPPHNFCPRGPVQEFVIKLTDI